MDGVLKGSWDDYLRWGWEEIGQIFGEDISDMTIEADNAIIEPGEYELKSKLDHIENIENIPSQKSNIRQQ